MTQDTLTLYGVPSTIPSHGGNSTGGIPCRRFAFMLGMRGSFLIACWRVLEIARVGKGKGGQANLSAPLHHIDLPTVLVGDTLTSMIKVAFTSSLTLFHFPYYPV